MSETKKCGRCKEEKPATNEFFNKDSKTKTGLRSYCKICQSIDRKEIKIPKKVSVLPDGFKMCSKCGEIKIATNDFFPKDSSVISGLKAQCKICNAVATKERYIPKEKTIKIINTHKKCTECKKELPLTNEYFYTRKEAGCGFKSKCKKCEEVIQKRKRKQKRTLKLTIKIEIPKNKICNKCGEELPLTGEYFSKASKGKFGFKSSCKKCNSNYQKESRISNPEKTRERDRLNKKKHAEKIRENNKIRREKNREQLALKCKEYREENPDKVKAYNDKYRKENEEKIKIATSRWRKKNPHKTIEYRHKRMAKMLQLDYGFNISDWNKCISFFNNECAYCGSKEKLTQDHFIPVSKGGEYTINNIIPVCSWCNSSKHVKDFEEWYSEKPFYSEERKKKIYKYLNYKGNIQQLSLI